MGAHTRACVFVRVHARACICVCSHTLVQQVHLCTRLRVSDLKSTAVVPASICFLFFFFFFSFSSFFFFFFFFFFFLLRAFYRHASGFSCRLGLTVWRSKETIDSPESVYCQTRPGASSLSIHTALLQLLRSQASSTPTVPCTSQSNGRVHITWEEGRLRREMGRRGG